MEASTDSNQESALAEDIISAQFKKSVSNDSLVIVISTRDASSLATQQFIKELSDAINGSSSVTGIKNITSVYTILIPALNQTNEGVYAAYYGGNLTYNLLYSVPTIYSNVWYQAYNTAKEQLTSGISQTNQGVYTLMENANMTYSLLYGVPAAYSTVWATAYNQTHLQLVDGLNQSNQGVFVALQNGNLTYNILYGGPAIFLDVWTQTYSQTVDVGQSNQIAYQQTATTLQQADPEAFTLYTSQLLDAFYGAWTQSFSDPQTATWTPLERATAASTQTNQLYINTFLAGDPTSQAFVTALTSALTFENYLTYTPEQNNAALTAFAIQTVVAGSGGLSSPEFVTVAYNLGETPSDSALNSLADTIIFDPAAYNMGTDFISTFNEVAYTQTAAILQQADPASYDQYTAPLLYVFNATWVGTFQNPETQALPTAVRASFAANITNQQYINTALAGNATMKAFVTALTQAFTLDHFMYNTQEQNNAQLCDFSVNYVANQANSAASFVRAAYDLGKSPSSFALSYLANEVIWYPEQFGMTKFIPTFNSVSYEQTEKILKDIDESSFNDYTSHLLDLFNASWTRRVPTLPIPSPTWINSTASTAADIANAQFIATYLNATETDFANQIASTLKLQDYLNGNTADTNAKIKNLTINYVANESSLSEELVEAIYDMGENATESAIRTLASQVVSNPDAFNIGQPFKSLITSFVSPANDVTLVSITFENSDNANLLAIREIIAEKLVQNPTDVTSAQVTGNDALNYDFGQSTNQDLELILPVTIALLVIATALFFRSIVTPIITLGTIGVGLGVSQIFPYLVGTYLNQVDYTVTTVLLTVLIGVGTDYSIFIVARHREERINKLPLFEAIKKSITWAGESIVTSGATVIISFLALSATSMVMMQTMGIIVGLGVIVTLLASLTVAPALTAILGDRIFWPNSGERFERYAKSIKEKNQRRGGYFARSGAFSVKHGKVIILIAVLVTVPTFYVYATTTPTYNLLGSASGNLESVAASNALTDSFGGGRLMPTYVVVTFENPIVNNGGFNLGEMATLQSMSSGIASSGGIHQVTGPTMPFGEAVDYRTITNETDSTTYSGIIDTIGADNQSALITVQFTVDPYSTEAMNYAQALRDSLHATYDGTANITGIYVDGTTGATLDTRVTFQNQFNQILPIVALGVGLVLFFVLGSLILPVFAVLSVLMSIVWTLAITVVVFQSVFGYGLLFITPLILFVLLLGLGMDYNIFILTRIREEAAKGQSLNDAIVHAVQQTGGIITAAAVILAGSLGALMLSSNMMMKEMGFAFAFSILIDALVVRTYLVPAVMSVFGKWNWYNPIKRLQRIKHFEDNQPQEQPQPEPKIE